MKVEALSIPGAYLLTSPVFPDGRGFFREWFRFDELAELAGSFSVRQANLSRSTRGTVRGLHYSLAPEGQAKVVTCSEGVLDDVVVDVRVGSPTFGRVEYVELRADEGRSVVVPAGAAHGFCVRSDAATIVYLLSSPYNPAAELEVWPFDESLAVPWRLDGEPILSDKDARAPRLAERLERGELPHFAA